MVFTSRGCVDAEASYRQMPSSGAPSTGSRKSAAAAAPPREMRHENRFLAPVGSLRSTMAARCEALCRQSGSGAGAQSFSSGVVLVVVESVVVLVVDVSTSDDVVRTVLEVVVVDAGAVDGLDVVVLVEVVEVELLVETDVVVVAEVEVLLDTVVVLTDVDVLLVVEDVEEEEDVETVVLLVGEVDEVLLEVDVT